jgi:hypothetical protein
MTWEYAAVVSAEFRFGESHNISKWILISKFSNINYESDGDSRWPTPYTIVKESEKIDNLYKTLRSIKNNDLKRGKCVDKISEIANSIVSEPFDNVLCVGVNALDLVNRAAAIGWETTGQVPGYPGPTSVTMMRRRVE